MSTEMNDITRVEASTKYPTAPIRILEAISDYAENRTPKGDFVTAVLENNLSLAVFLADSESLKGLVDIVRFVHWEIPAPCHGSKEIVEAWIEGTGKTWVARHKG